MNQSKFSLADTLTVLSTLIFGFFCFLSFNFLSVGDTVPSIIKATVFALILGSLAFLAKLLKKTSVNFKTCIIIEWISLFLFAIIAIAFIFPFSHFFSVSAKKADIQQKLTANITKADSLFDSYETYANKRINMYNKTLHSIVVSKGICPPCYYNSGFVDGVDVKTQIDNKLFTLKSKLYPSNYQNIKQVDSTWLSNAKSTIEDWSPISVVNLVNNIEINVTTWKNELTQFSTFKAEGGNPNYFYYPFVYENTKDEFMTKGSPTTLSILLAIGLYVLMLLSYFITKRHTRYPGLKVIFGTGNTLENEL